MKFREALVATLREERRPSRRVALMAFVRRYSRRDVPVTSWRGTGDTSDAIMSLLSKCGLRDGGAVSLTRSSLDASAWKLAFNPGYPLAEEFVNCCRDVGAPDEHGNTLVDRALSAMYANVDSLPTTVELLFPPDRQEEAAPAEPAAPSFARAVEARTAEILAAVAAMPNPPVTPGYLNTEIASAKKMAGHIPNAPCAQAVAPLPVVEAYVRHVMRNTDRVPYDGYSGSAPEFSVFPGDYQRRLGTPIYVRPIMPDDPDIPLRSLTSAPVGYLDGTLVQEGEDSSASSPVHGYLVKSISELNPEEVNDAKQLLIVGCAPVVGSDTAASIRVNKALFIANHPEALWDYVRWLYDCAYKGVSRCWLTPHLRVGVPACRNDALSLRGNPAYESLPLRSDNTMFRCGDAEVLGGLRSFGAAVFALVFADASLEAPPHGKGTAEAVVVHVPSTEAITVGNPPEDLTKRDEDTESDSMYLGKSDLPIEWFWMTHSTGVAPDGRYETAVGNWNQSDSVLRAGTASLRDFYRKAVENPGRTLLQRCSFERSEGMLSRTRPGGVWFHPAAAFYSGLLALIRSYATHLSFRGWSGREPWSWGIHGPGGVFTAVYSGIETDLSPSTADAGVFPKMDWLPLDALMVELGARPDPNAHPWTERFTHNIEVLSTKGIGMVKMASRSKGTERTKVIVVETNVDAGEFCRGLSLSTSREFTERAKELFVQTFGYRNENVLCVADRTGGMDDTRRETPEYSAFLASMLYANAPSTAGAASAADFYRSGSAPTGLSDGSWWASKVRVGAMVDASNRLYLVFRATGDAGQAMSVGWRYCSRLPVSSATIAAKGGRRVLRGTSRYVPADMPSVETASSILERRFQLYDQDSHMTIAGTRGDGVGVGGRITPLFMPETVFLTSGEVPSKPWYREQGRFTSVTELLG